LDGSLPKICQAVRRFDQDGRHSAVALLLKAALIQVSNYRLLGASGFIFTDQKVF
jgi:Arc/MetJ family transcription regulator